MVGSTALFCKAMLNDEGLLLVLGAGGGCAELDLCILVSEVPHLGQKTACGTSSVLHLGQRTGDAG